MTPAEIETAAKADEHWLMTHVLQLMCFEPGCINHVYAAGQCQTHRKHALRGRPAEPPFVHGTYAGALKHRRRGERPCQECLDGQSAYMRDYRNGIRA